MTYNIYNNISPLSSQMLLISCDLLWRVVTGYFGTLWLIFLDIIFVMCYVWLSGRVGWAFDSPQNVSISWDILWQNVHLKTRLLSCDTFLIHKLHILWKDCPDLVTKYWWMCVIVRRCWIAVDSIQTLLISCDMLWRMVNTYLYINLVILWLIVVDTQRNWYLVMCCVWC